MECVRIFHERLKRMMREWVYVSGGKEKGIFGRVKDYVIRYEVQDRGCVLALATAQLYCSMFATHAVRSTYMFNNAAIDVHSGHCMHISCCGCTRTT